MITPETISRINELARKQREHGLNEAEKSEQAKLRRLYIDYIKAQVKAGLEASRAADHGPGCGCGCHSDH